jgi:hypothetical protein
MLYLDNTYKFYDLSTLTTKSGQVALHHWDRELEVDLRAVCTAAAG